MPLAVSPGISSVPGGAANRVFIDSYDTWRAAVQGERFDPFRDAWWNKSAFWTGQRQADVQRRAAQRRIGNAAKNNPHSPFPWLLNENITLSKNVDFTEKVKFTLRREAFNLLTACVGRPGFDRDIGRISVLSAAKATTRGDCSSQPR